MTKNLDRKVKHILIVSQYFYPENFRINDIATSLTKRGYKITVLTGIPNYPEGKFYSGYSWTHKRKETWGEVNVIRLPIVSRGKSKLKLIFNYYSFVILGKIWARFTRIKFDVVFTFGISPIIQAEISYKISNRLKIPHYFYVQDLWPDNLEAIGGIKNKLVLKHYYNLCKKIYDKSHTIFTTSKSFVETLKQRTKSKVIYLPQYAEDIYKPVPKKELKEIKNDNKFKIIFTGNIGKSQGLDILVDVAKKLKNVIFVIIGNGRYKQQFLNNIKDVKDKFIIIDRKLANEIPYYLKSCDVAFISYANNVVLNKTIPAKLQSYMACGMPILASASGECKRIIEESKCGYCSEPGNVDGLIYNINKFRDAKLEIMSQNSLHYSDKNFKKEDIIKTLCDEFDEYNN